MINKLKQKGKVSLILLRLYKKMNIAKKIPVIMVTDQNYIFQTRVTIWSMRQSTNPRTVIEIIIFCSPKLDITSRIELTELQDCLPNIQISFYEIDENIFRNKKKIGVVPIASSYRLFAGEAINENKCIFVDGDMIVDIDLNMLFSIELTDEYIAGVIDLGFVLHPDKAEQHRNRIGLTSMDTYINAGTLLFNLKKIREDHLQDYFLQELSQNHLYMDQDILNKVCFGKIKLLPLKYNVFANVPISKISPMKELPKESLKEADSKERILHFVGTYKPWNNIRINGAALWWEYAKYALDEKIYTDMYTTAVQLSNQSDWSYILERCNEESEIIIIGYSNIGVDVYESLKRCGINSKFFFCDNSKEKQENKNGTKVSSVEEMADQHPNALWLNTSQLGRYEINLQLIQLGISQNRIVIYKDKNNNYYETLNKAFVEYERQQHELKDKGYSRRNK